MYNELLDDEQYHNDDVSIIRESSLDKINIVKIDYESVAARNLNYIRENIAREKAYQEEHLTPVID